MIVIPNLLQMTCLSFTNDVPLRRAPGRVLLGVHDGDAPGPVRRPRRLEWPSSRSLTTACLLFGISHKQQRRRDANGLLCPVQACG